MRENYNVVKAKVQASCTYYCSYYELRVWFEDSNIESQGYIYNIDNYEIKQLSGVKRGDGFKKIQTFLDTKEGMNWLSDKLYKQDFKKESDRLKDSIRSSIYDMSLEQLEDVKNYAKSLLEKENENEY